MNRVCALAALVALSSSTAALADEWHAGLNLRADLGTHPIRAGGGVDLGRFDTMLVLDPMFWTDGQHDIDLYSTVKLSERGWGVVAGLRVSAIGISGGHQFQDKLVLGVAAPLPLGPPLRARWAFEAATMLVKHGGDLPSSWISFETGRDFVDLINFGMFVTVEWSGAL
jgi:hypothetical protein